MAKICLLADTHFGVRKNSEAILKYQKKFFDNYFFPAIDKLGIKHIIHLGDVFHSRENVNFLTLKYAQEMFFDQIQSRKIDFTVLIGNHDTYYTTTNSLDSLNVLTDEYDFNIITKPSTINVAGCDICILPWVIKENIEDTYKEINETKAEVVMGHLEIQGFTMAKGHINKKGFDTSVFNKFKSVMSGHFHLKSFSKI